MKKLMYIAFALVLFGCEKSLRDLDVDVQDPKDFLHNYEVCNKAVIEGGIFWSAFGLRGEDSTWSVGDRCIKSASFAMRSGVPTITLSLESDNSCEYSGELVYQLLSSGDVTFSGNLQGFGKKSVLHGTMIKSPTYFFVRNADIRTDSLSYESNLALEEGYWNIADTNVGAAVDYSYQVGITGKATSILGSTGAVVQHQQSWTNSGCAGLIEGVCAMLFEHKRERIVYIPETCERTATVQIQEEYTDITY